MEDSELKNLEEIAEKYVAGLSTEDAKKELEFLITKCYIDSFANKLQAFFTYKEIYTKSKSGSADKNRSRMRANEICDEMIKAYQKIPLSELGSIETLTAKKPHYLPFLIVGQYVLSESFPELISEVFSKQDVKSNRVEEFEKAIFSMGEVGRLIGKTINSLQDKLKKETGTDYLHLPMCNLNKSNGNLLR